MKLFILMFVFMLTFAAQAITNDQVDDLLHERGTSVAQVQAKGMKVFFGENTGHIPFAKIRFVITGTEAILQSEIESYDASGGTLGTVRSLRYNGRYILKSDIKAAVSAQ